MKRLYDCEFVLMHLLWREGSLSSRRLAELCEKSLSWKRTTTYTVLRRLCDAGYVRNEHATVVPLVSREDALAEAYRSSIGAIFCHDPTMALTAMLADVTLSDKEARALKRIIDAHRKTPRKENQKTNPLSDCEQKTHREEKGI